MSGSALAVRVRVDEWSDAEFARIQVLLVKVGVARERLLVLIERIEATRRVAERQTIAVRDHAVSRFSPTRPDLNGQH
jgi:hypothetical protein